MIRPSLSALLLLIAVLAACSGSSNSQQTDGRTDATTVATETSTKAARAQLLAAVRSAIANDHRLSIGVLWTNVVASNPRATAGPALANLRRSVAARKRRGIRVRLISERFRVVSVSLDPSYTRATAIISDPQRVRPYGRDGRPLGRPVTLNEHVRLELHRIGNSERFVVWRVVALR
jgi:hypothetical protein